MDIIEKRNESLKGALPSNFYVTVDLEVSKLASLQRTLELGLGPSSDCNSNPQAGSPAFTFFQLHLALTLARRRLLRADFIPEVLQRLAVTIPKYTARLWTWHPSKPTG